MISLFGISKFEVPEDRGPAFGSIDRDASPVADGNGPFLRPTRNSPGAIAPKAGFGCSDGVAWKGAMTCLINL